MVNVVISGHTGGNLIFKDTSMLILYKNDRNVRFVLFTKTTINCKNSCTLFTNDSKFFNHKGSDDRTERNKNTEGTAYVIKITGRNVFSYFKKIYTGWERLIRSRSSARFCFELSGNSN